MKSQKQQISYVGKTQKNPLRSIGASKDSSDESDFMGPSLPPLSQVISRPPPPATTQPYSTPARGELISEILDLDVFRWAKGNPGRTSVSLLDAFCALLKAAAGTDASDLANARAELSTFFSADPIGAQVAPAFDASPARSPSFFDLVDRGAAASTCNVEHGDVLVFVSRGIEFRARFKVERYAYDEKRDGCLERDELGVWDSQVTGPKAFVASFVRDCATYLGSGAYATEFLMDLQATRSFSRTGYFPGRNESIVKFGGVRWLNTYRGPLLSPAPGNWSDYDELTLHLAGGDLAAQSYILDMLAMPLQSLATHGKPLKTLTVLVFQTVPGAGKQLLQLALMEFYGQANVVVFSQDQMDSKFTGALKNKLFVVLNEVMSSTNRSGETANKLKAMATDEIIASESKGVEAENIKNVFNMMVTSNDDRPVSLERGDRRYSIFKQPIPLDKRLAIRLVQDRNGSQAKLAAFYDHLLTRAIKAVPGDLFENEARKNLISSSENSATQFWEEVKEVGWIGVCAPWVGRAPRDTIRDPTIFNSEWIPWSRIGEVYQDWCKWAGMRPMNSSGLQAAMKSAFPLAVSGRERDAGVQVRAWKNIPLLGVSHEQSPEPVSVASPNSKAEEDF